MRRNSRGAPMSEVEFDDWMTENDAVMWHIERDPLLRSTITTVWVLDCEPDESRFDATLDRAIAAIPRLRQRVVADRGGIAPPKWETDPLFEPDYHIRRGRVGGDGTLRDLLDAAEPISMQAFDKDRPLWELHQLDGMADGRVGVVMKLHHAISDGVGLVRMTEALIETERDPVEQTPVPPLPPPPATRTGDATHTGDAIAHQVQTGVKRGIAGTSAAARGTWNMVRDPVGTTRSFTDTASSIARSLRPVTEPLSPIMGERSMANRFDAILMDFDRLKAAAKVCDGTVNDVYVAAMLGGLDRYHRHHDAPVDELRMTMPINIRTGDDRGRSAGNVFAPARFTVPVGITDPIERVARIHQLVQHERAEPAYPRTGQVAAAIYNFRPAVFTRLLGSMLKSIDFVTSNVPGPWFPVYMSGARIERSIGYGPLSGAAANLTLYSYDGAAEIGINTDRAAVPDPDVFTGCLQSGLDEIAALG